MFNREPALIIGAIQAVIALAIGFGLHVTPEQFGLIMAAVAAIMAVVVRTQVTSENTVNALIKEAVKSPAGTNVETVKAAVESKS